MARSTKDAWLSGPADLREEDVEDVPVKGDTVRVRALPAKVSAEVQSQMRVETKGREQVARIDAAEMEVLQFAHGVIDPPFSVDEARLIAARFGPAFRKVIEKIDELSGIDKEAIEKTEARFPDSGPGENGSAGGSSGPPVAVAAGETGSGR